MLAIKPPSAFLKPVLFGLVLACATPCHANTAPIEVKHYAGGYSSPLKPYFMDVLTLTLDLTVEEYGPYEIQLNASEISAIRAKAEAKKGELINVLFTTGWAPQETPTSNIVNIEIPLFNDLLGLRGLIVSANTPLATPPTSRKAFTQFTAGQGLGWEDVNILQASGIQVTEGPTFKALFPMLQRGRFDYLPLSVLEIDQSFTEHAEKYPGMYIYKKVYIFYPMVLSLNINKHNTQLVERLRLGIERAKGAKLLAIFNKHFTKTYFDKTQKNALFIANNVLIPKERNAEITQRFLKNHGKFFSVLE